MTRLWLVERSYDDRDLVSFTYATVDGTQQLRKQLSMALLRQRGPTTAAIEVDDEELSAVDESDRAQFAAEAEKMQSKHDPDDEI
jgi:outer membrane biogenesis lipoprotein LolB